ncbi:MFS transporter [Jatrophihabitans sp.]|uniref:MFS transporter n=1 Tax=Jatrophihabitans sp. TaxID=1932789 RepID=UPI002BF0B26E|nr:MFS transporter [Jatrophihabitans sp.]
MTVRAEPRAPGGRAGTIFSPAYRVTTLGILILMTIIAFEALAVATALPTAARSLHGLASYGWAFTGFLVTSVVGMVVSGMYSDLHGARRPLLAGLLLFVAGLLVGSAANTMLVLVAARFVQGLAVGLLITAMYVVMGEVYDDLLRPRIFAALAGAWVIPGLVGPMLAGWITEQLSWRWVFGGLSPFVALGGLLILPSLRQLRGSVTTGRIDHRRVGYALLTAVGVAGVANLGEHLDLLGAAGAAVGLVAMLAGLRRLLPAGTARFASGVPAAIAFRGVLAGVFVGMEVIVPLTLTVQLHYSPTMAGTPLMLSALSWAAASTIQSRLPHPNRARLVALGLVLMAVGGVGMALVALRTVPGAVAFALWPFAGFGAGFAITSASVVMLECTTDAQRGSDSAALQLADSSVSAISAAFAGAFVALAAHGRIGYGTGFAVVFVAMAGLAAVAIGRASRLTGAAVRRPADGAPVSPAVPGVTGTGPATGADRPLSRSVECSWPGSVSS